MLAIGGPFYDDDQVFRYKNQNWHPIGEGVVIMNRNLSCFLLGNTGAARRGARPRARPHARPRAQLRQQRHAVLRGESDLDDALMRAIGSRRRPRPPSQLGRHGRRTRALRPGDERRDRARPPSSPLSSWSTTSRCNGPTAPATSRGSGSIAGSAAASFAVIGQTAAGVTTLADAEPRRRHLELRGARVQRSPATARPATG